MIGLADSRRRRMSAASFVVVVWGAVASIASAQVTTGAIAGRVLEEGGPSVAGATVTARNVATGFRRSAISEATGGFRIDALPAGSYDVTAEAPGFGTGLAADVIVHASEFTNVAFALKSVRAVAVQEPQGQGGAPPPDPMKKGPRLQIYGFAMPNLIYDFNQVNPDWYDIVRPTKLPAFPNEFGENGNFWASVRQTRFGVRGWLPTGLGEVRRNSSSTSPGSARRGRDDVPSAPGVGRARAVPHRPDQQRLHGQRCLPEHRSSTGG